MQNLLARREINLMLKDPRSCAFWPCLLCIPSLACFDNGISLFLLISPAMIHLPLMHTKDKIHFPLIYLKYGFNLNIYTLNCVNNANANLK